MNPAKVAVFLLKLISLGAVLFSLIASVQPLFVPIPRVEAPGFGTVEFPSGCFVLMLLIFSIPLSLIPAFAAWVIQQRFVLPREAAERRWRDAVAEREERLWAWTGYAARLLDQNRGVGRTAADPVPSLRAAIPRALGELDLGRRERLLLFLREAGLADAIRGVQTQMAASASDTATEPVETPPRRSLVMAVAVLLSMASAFLVLWIGLSAITILTTDVHKVMQESLGITIDKTQLLMGIPGCLIPALLPGLAAAGLLRMYRRAVRSLGHQEGSRAVVQDRALRGAVESLGAGATSQVARAAALIAFLELDGSRRGKLIQALFDSGWLTGDARISLEGADLRGAELAGASLAGACLSGVDLSGADLSRADLGKADLRQSALRGSNLRSCRLTGAHLRNADLRGARFQKAALEGADLREVLLDGANFWGAELSGAELTGARGAAEFLNLKAETV